MYQLFLLFIAYFELWYQCINKLFKDSQPELGYQVDMTEAVGNISICTILWNLVTFSLLKLEIVDWSVDTVMCK
jgi:hypothetical protein